MLRAEPFEKIRGHHSICAPVQEARGDARRVRIESPALSVLYLLE